MSDNCFGRFVSLLINEKKTLRERLTQQFSPQIRETAYPHFANFQVQSQDWRSVIVFQLGA